MISDIHNSKALDKTDVKCRFFSQYWGQLYEFKNTKTKWIVNEGAFPLEKDGNERLILTNLKNITDEDAIEVEKIISLKRKNIQHLKEDIYNLFADDHLIIKSTVLSLNHAYQYLQSKGYAVPFMEYSIKDLISFDWVRLV
jgi:hypothetical protein